MRTHTHAHKPPTRTHARAHAHAIADPRPKLVSLQSRRSDSPQKAIRKSYKSYQKISESLQKAITPRGLQVWGAPRGVFARLTDPNVTCHDTMSYHDTMAWDMPRHDDVSCHDTMPPPAPDTRPPPVYFMVPPAPSRSNPRGSIFYQVTNIL